ncbi:hypothetical protein [Photobacterium carnosum]|uniref:hypothetical protein n=1 Tax=Photobacterium carnosum TaxID=2023717 RepID=UPI001E5BE5A3|nr:hypothetical protein [Photobacterium carnosum]MCD9528346.1 hypothetical protein [Photobacterium carnosum]
MAIKFWTPRHRTYLYGIFDNVRLYNFAVLDAEFVRDMLDQKLTPKAYRRIESEWSDYWEDIFAEEPSEGNKLLAYRINRNQIMLLKVSRTIGIAKAVSEKHEDYFNLKVVEITDDEDE